MVEHYFVAAWLPSGRKEVAARVLREEARQRPVCRRRDRAGRHDRARAPPGEVRVPLYVGPQDQDALAKLAKGLDLVVDYGIFTVIAAPLFWLLKWLHGIIGNWGWAIIVHDDHDQERVLSAQPCERALDGQDEGDRAEDEGAAGAVRERQAAAADQDDGDVQEEKINPLGGCLPILVQIPVFIALYWVLLSAVELRHAPWIRWIHDLSAPDPYYVLPVIYAITA